MTTHTGASDGIDRGASESRCHFELTAVRRERLPVTSDGHVRAANFRALFLLHPASAWNSSLSGRQDGTDGEPVAVARD